MTKIQLAQIISNDPYHIKRKAPTEAELRLYLREVDYHCPLCGKELQSQKQKKPNQKLFEIAHIYPNSPTIEQYEALHTLERLGKDSEDYDNKIALCLGCHSTQDFQTTPDEYLKLVKIKKNILVQTAMNDITNSLSLEDDIEIVINKLCSVSDEELAQLNYDPVPIANKFSRSDGLLKAKISGYVLQYYTFIREAFRQIDGERGFHLEILSGQIKSCFIKLNDTTNDKSTIFSNIVKWISNKTLCKSTEACEAVVAFFVQNCEVFYEIS